MKLAWISDPHLECLAHSSGQAFVRYLAAHAVDAFVITGDLSDAVNLGYHLSLFASLQVPVYFVLGNHDFYQGSFASVDEVARKACRKHPNLVHLGHGEVIRLTTKTSLIGHRGWADGRAGVGDRSKTRLNDHLLIENLKNRESEVLFAILNALGDQSADYMRTKAEEALPGCRQLLIATHVPPFPQSALYQEKPSGPEFAPHFVNVAMGSVLLDLAQRHPDKKLTVLAGHTHHVAYYSPLPNLVVKVADGRYFHPAVAEVITL